MTTQPDNTLLWGGMYHPGNGTSLYKDLDDLSMLENMSRPKTEMAEYIEKLSYYLMGIGGSITCCLGTIANALSIAVLTRRSMRSSTYTYLTALAVCDSLVLFLTLIIIIDDTQPPDSLKQANQFHAILFPFVHPSAVVFQVTSIWLTLAFTVDRYIMICHPFRAETMCRRSRARKVIVCLYVAGLVFNIPRFFEYSTKLETLTMDNSSQVFTFYGIQTTPLGNSVIFRELIHSWLYLLFICGIPFLLMVILNAFLIRAVHLSRLKGKEINPREKHRNDTTIMLIGVIVIFLICQGPALVSRMIYAFQPVSASTKAVITLNEVANFFVYLNSAINIVPYYLFGRKFRSEFWRIFCSCCLDIDELRKINRSYSVSVDQRRMSQYTVIEMNGVSQPNHNTVLSGDRGNSALGHSYVYNDQKCRLISRGTTTCLLHSDSDGSVAAPLMHGIYHSLSSHRLGNRDAGKDSARTNGSQISSSTELLSSQNSYTNPSGPLQYMTVTAGSCIRGPEGSPV